MSIKDMKLRRTESGNFKALIPAIRVDTFNRSSVLNLMKIDNKNIKIIV